MSNVKICPNCGAKIKMEDEFCQECGTRLHELADERSDRGVSKVEADNQKDSLKGTSGADNVTFSEGSRTNIGGNVTNTSNHMSTDNTVNNVHTSNTVNSSHVDQSTTMNSTTILMNEKQKEYCSVCGKSLDETHARCPQCGKNVCAECIVPGKNRCQKCEKKAVNDFRSVVKQMVLVSSDEFTIAEQEMIYQKAVELDVEEYKDRIVRDVVATFKPTRPKQNVKVMSAAPASTTPVETPAPKGVGVLDENRAPSSDKGGSLKKVLVAAVIGVVTIGGYLAFSGGDGSKQDSTPSVEAAPSQKNKTTDKVKDAQPVQGNEKKIEKTVESTVAPQKNVTTESKVHPTSKPQVQNESNSQKIKPDLSYEEGLKAYNKGDGLNAVKAFKKSGSAQSVYMLGMVYKNGCGNIGKNAMMARKYFKQAAEMGFDKANAML